MASFFNAFPKIDYTFGDTIAKIDDITIRIDIVMSVIDNASNFQIYDIQEGETPEILSYNYYNDPSLHWAILLANKMISRGDWPLDTNSLNKYITQKYNKPTDTHHFTTEVNGVNYDFTDSTKSDPSTNPSIVVQIDGDEVTAFPVTNESFERNLNDDKRQIKLLKPEALSDVFAELKRLLEDDNS